MGTPLDLLLGTHPSWSLLVVRLGVGIVMFAHGAQKVFGWFGGRGLGATIQAFQQHMKIPPAATVINAFIECFGGLALIVGLLARPAALGVIVVMLVAIAKVHWPNGFFLSTTPGKGNGFEFNLALIALALAVLVGGAGILSIDRAIWLIGK
jgi:putative oxidoreductase